MDLSSFSKRVSSLITSFKKLEKDLKNLESIDELNIPSINEIRYFAFHLCKFLSLLDKLPTYAKEADSELSKAQGHLDRGFYDCYEAQIIYFLDSIKLFRELFKENISCVLSIIQNYSEILKEAEEAKNLIKNIREKTDTERRDYYKQLRPHVKKLKDSWTKLDISKEEILALIAEKKSRSKTKMYINIGLPILTFIVGLFINKMY